MRQRYFILSAAISAVLANAPGALLAQSVVTRNVTPLSVSTPEAPRVTQTITNANVVTIQKTHPAFVAQATSSAPLADTATMNHLQLVLKPSASRTAAMESLISNQHNPTSAQFHQWLTPQQFGDSFGVVDSDIAAVTSWLTAQGFVVNYVYPNKAQIDFTGTAAQVSQAFHTRENIYTIGSEKHLANAGDISVPTALRPVIEGVMGLSDVHPTALHTKSKSQVAKWSKSENGFVSNTSTNSMVGSKSIGQAMPFTNGMRGLVPNDMVTMYGIRTIRNNGVVGKGITIAVVESGDMVPTDWSNFVSQFNLAQYGGTFNLINPAPSSGANNCNDPSVATFGESDETILDAEWATAIAPGANIEVASCSDYNADQSGPSSTNFFGGVFIAATNLINANTRPDIISASYGFGEFFVDSSSKTAIDLMWAQADAEGISVFVSTGDSGSNPSFNGGIIYSTGQGNAAVDANAFATSPHDTGVGGTDLADILDGTTSQYFAPTPSVVGGSALSYVPEIPWNTSCGNGVAATSLGYSSAVAFCLDLMKHDPRGNYQTSEAGSGGPSSVDAKPAWQRQIYNAANDQSRDLPDVSLFAGSYGGYTSVILCTANYPCTPDWSTPVELVEGTSLSAPMFAGIQALVDQGIAARGLPADQGNAAPTLYALAAEEYGGAIGTPPASLSTCNANNGAAGTSSCVFHNVTRGSNSTQCEEFISPLVALPNCYIYGQGAESPYTVLGLTTSDASPTTYGPSNKAFGAQPGWSFTSGLGSVNATNLLIAWRAFVHAPAATVAP
ncbi:S53 family peptidase [Dyella dinghuensis]|nr:protease pro-enzyme activation domain-containing protein [Dyella dinghuensis]